MSYTTYEYINNNKKATFVIVALFPLLLSLLMYGTVWLFVSSLHSPRPGDPSVAELVNHLSLTFFPWIIAGAIVWILVSYLAGDKIMIAAADAYEIDKPANPEIYNLVENVAITCGVPMPRLYIIPDSSANAFATGRTPQTASIVLTEGIVARLSKRELEGVIAHEMAHIINRDVRLMMIVITGIGFFTFLGQIFLRAGIRSKKNGAVFAILGLALIFYGLFLAPLIMYALSRRREFQADATAAIITRDPESLASALIKISADSRVEALDSMGLMSAACIEDASDKSALSGFMSSLFSTHPPIEQRVSLLRSMGGLGN